MSRPRDHYLVDRVGAVKAARIFSDVVSPPVLFAALGLAFSLRELPPVPALLWAALYGFLVSLAPILFVLYLLKSGRAEELHLSNTSERHLPYLLAVVNSAVALGLVRLWQGPELLGCLALFNIITLSLLALINVRWLISFHATAAVAAAAVTGFVFGLSVALSLAPLVGLIVVVRLYLRRHTLPQVAAGIALGAGTVYLLVLLGCFR